MRYFLSIIVFLIAFHSSVFAEEIKVWSVRNVSYTDPLHKTAILLKAGDILKSDMKITIKDPGFLLAGTNTLPFSFVEIRIAGTYTLTSLWAKKYVVSDSLSLHAQQAYEVINGTYKDPYEMNRPATVYRYSISKSASMARHGPEQMKLYYMRGDEELKTNVLSGKAYTIYWTTNNENFKKAKLEVRNLFEELIATPVLQGQQVTFTYNQLSDEPQLIFRWNSTNEQEDPFERLLMINKKIQIYPDQMEQSLIVASGNSYFSMLIAAEYCKSKQYYLDAVEYYVRIKETDLLKYLEK